MKLGFLGKPTAANIMLTRAAKKKPKPKPNSPPPADLPPSPYNFEIPQVIQKVATEHSPCPKPWVKKRDAILRECSADMRLEETATKVPELSITGANDVLILNQPHYVQANVVTDMEHPPGFGPNSRPLSEFQTAALGSDFQSGNSAPTWFSLFKNKPRNAGRISRKSSTMPKHIRNELR